MAQGSVVAFEEFVADVGLKVHNLNTDTHKISLHNVLPATDADAKYATFSATEVSRTNYTATGETANITYAEVSGTGTLALGTAITWTADGAGPTDIKYGLVYSDTATNDEAIGTIDMTTDGGSTALSLVDGDITISAGTILTIAKA